jgi:hypothetical protein
MIVLLILQLLDGADLIPDAQRLFRTSGSWLAAFISALELLQ